MIDYGLRLAFTGGRVRLAMMTGGVAVGVALLLGVAGVLPAAAERIAKTAARGVEMTSETAHEEGVRATLSIGYWRGRELRVLRVETVGRSQATPLGVPRTPRPGEAYLSPALASALAGQHRDELRPRLPERIVGAVGRDALVGPDELYAIVGAEPGTLDGNVSAGFATPDRSSLFVSQAAYVDGTGMRQEANAAADLLVAVGLAGVGLVVPLLILVGTSTRLSAATRERRMSAMRLVGATARQLRVFGAVEAFAVGVLGTAAGAGLFYGIRGPVAAFVPADSGLYASDVSPPVPAVIAIALGIPALAALAGRLALRRAVASPLGARRQALPPRAGVAHLLPLGAGLLLLVVAYAADSTVLLLGGAALCLVGLAVGAAALARFAGEVLSRWGPGVASQLAGRYLVGDPMGTARAVTGTGLVVLMLGWVAALLPLFTQGGVAPAQGLRPTTMAVSLGSTADLTPTVAALRHVEGVSAVAPVRHARMLPTGVQLPDSYTAGGTVEIGDQPVRALIVDCAELSKVLSTPLSGCRPGTVQHVAGARFDAAQIEATRSLVSLEAEGAPLAVPALRESVRLPAALIERTDGLSLDGDLLVPPALMPQSAPDSWYAHILIATDGRAATLEAVRARLGNLPMPFPPLTAAEAAAVARASNDGYADAALIVVLLVILVGALSLTVTTADSLRERRRAHSALSAIGTPTAVLRRGVLLQISLPLLLVIGVAVAVSAATSWLYLRVVATGGTLPWGDYATIGVVALIACVLANVATLPLVRAAARPDALRAE